jgi:hypothetical protein
VFGLEILHGIAHRESEFRRDLAVNALVDVRQKMILLLIGC